MEPAGGIDDEGMGASGLGGLGSVVGHCRRVGSGLVLDYLGAAPPGPSLQLLSCRGAKSVRSPPNRTFWPRL